MAKKIEKSNYRVATYPERAYGTWKDGEEERACEEIKKQILRHVDGIAVRNPQIFIEYDVEHICEFCGDLWETGVDDGCPLCCIEAEKEWEAAQQPEPA